MTPEEININIEKNSENRYSLSKENLCGKDFYFPNDVVEKQRLAFQCGMEEAISNPTDIGLCLWVKASDRLPVNMKAVFARDGIDMIVLFRQSDKWYSETNEEYFTDKEIEWLEEPIQ